MALEVCQKVMRVEHRVPMSAQPGGWTHAIEHQVVHRALARIERVALGVQPRVRRPAAVELGKQRCEPMRMLVVDPDHLVTAEASDAASSVARSMRSTRAGSGTPARNCASVP